MTHHVDRETAIEPAGEGRWTARLVPDWNIGPNPNGGYAAMPLLRALGATAAHPDPLTVTTHFLRPLATSDAVTITAASHRVGRAASTVSGAAGQGGHEAIVAVATFGELGDHEPHRGLVQPQVPDLPPPERCADRYGLEAGLDIALGGRVDVRLHPDDSTPGASDRAEIRCWVRFADDRPADPMTLPLLVDAPPPSAYPLIGAVGWIPTVELTVQVVRRPGAGWLRMRFETVELAGDAVVEDGTVWDGAGRVVARSRQRARLIER